MMNKLLSLLGFASKAGALAYGFGAVKESLSGNKAKLVLIAADISPKSRKEAAFFADKAKIQNITLESVDIDTLSRAVGCRCGIISVNDNGFAIGCLKALNEGGTANDQQI